MRYELRATACIRQARQQKHVDTGGKAEMGFTHFFFFSISLPKRALGNEDNIYSKIFWRAFENLLE
jgi:hypothetical protein